MLRSIKTNQRLERRLAFIIDGSVPELDVGADLGALVENSSGNYTITFTKPFARIPVVLATPATDVTTVRIITATASAVNIEQVGADQTTPTADGDIHLEVIGWDTAEEYSEPNT